MLIEVELTYGDQVAVPQEGLDRLLEHDWVKSFKRSSGWVSVGVGPIRSESKCREHFDGNERRFTNHGNQILH